MLKRHSRPAGKDSALRWSAISTSTCGLVAMASASHAEGRQFDPGQVYKWDTVRGTESLARPEQWPTGGVGCPLGAPAPSPWGRAIGS